MSCAAINLDDEHVCLSLFHLPSRPLTLQTTVSPPHSHIYPRNTAMSTPLLPHFSFITYRVLRRAFTCTRLPSLSSSFPCTKQLRWASSVPNQDPKTAKGITKEENAEQKETQKEKVELKAKEGRYKGLTVLEGSLPQDASTFNESLSRMYLPLRLLHLVSVCFHSWL